MCMDPKTDDNYFPYLRPAPEVKREIIFTSKETIRKIGRDDWIRTSDPLLPKRSKHPRFLNISVHYAGQIVPFAVCLYLWNANQARTDFPTG